MPRSHTPAGQCRRLVSEEIHRITDEMADRKRRNSSPAAISAFGAELLFLHQVYTKLSDAMHSHESDIPADVRALVMTRLDKRSGLGIYTATKGPEAEFKAALLHFMNGKGAGGT